MESVTYGEISTWNLYLDDYSAANISACIVDQEEMQAELLIMCLIVTQTRNYTI